jgi:hypothetical protein
VAASDGTEDVVIVFIPALAPLLLRAEQLKGAPLTEDKVIRIRDRASCVTMRQEEADKLEESRGYRDIDPEKCWAEWQALRPSLVGGNQE